MKNFRKNILESVAKASIKSAATSPNTMSVFYFYEPKMSEKLRKKIDKLPIKNK
ncbi:cyclic lactone autoinducer peptide [Tissierella sp. Yu-01]|uniref:cyclic lactone autoinducer peptide n=1 Tax=Tissierella sp. Yu-01 TaxID=3035694 RepID=UPI00240E2962|nr:cyclic lactone autoinducer peptide [Tissierella sp. Yu-01]WFA08227.1 cyclic lactone autoinducer peptide [Tissierella sp. Yu-01]